MRKKYETAAGDAEYVVSFQKFIQFTGNCAETIIAEADSEEKIDLAEILDRYSENVKFLFFSVQFFQPSEEAADVVVAGQPVCVIRRIINGQIQCGDSET